MISRSKFAMGAALLLPALAHGHPGHDAGMSFATGALHPLAGLDHLLALAATGLLAGRLGGRAGMAVMIGFPVLLALGAVSGLLGVEIASTESAILVSLVVLGLLALLPQRRLPVATATLTAVFAWFHGHAHGAEAAAGSASVAYVLGVVVSSVAVLVASASMGALIAPRAGEVRIDQPR